ncbi:mitochondrial ribosomal subunit S27-domain-containing protein [Thamnocephalis sphaerospora]|uniref:Small ribosomal subunit protein mS33 n=1 Tax=Thamnocephalis sphaerospora TaxID=78915 RepID=A0A4P9XTU9_9FUNG|nr:mitochondrial ribosomal subunit S27-domain-containing protein [Thamnocephalis sphaerospora]|eukprot:RKP09613.1 mitochondrial ribosomal subunit S27-domain-containing protein [Thamnocephalis sphaerospora]
MAATTHVAKARLATLAQLTARLFDNVYNPTGVRTGNKVLRQRLIGPAVSTYYPDWYGKEPRILRKISRAFPELELVNVANEERIDELERRKRRGKGAPKKGEGKRAQLGKKKK